MSCLRLTCVSVSVSNLFPIYPEGYSISASVPFVPHRVPALQQRHLCCSTPFQTGDTSAWRTWPIRLLYAWTVQIPRLDKILINSNKGYLCLPFCKSLYLFMPQMLVILFPLHTSHSHPTYLNNMAYCRPNIGLAGWILCTDERSECLPLSHSARGKHFLWKSPSTHKLPRVAFCRWGRGNRYVTVKKAKINDTSY